MDVIDPAKFIFAIFFVLGLLGLLAIVLRYIGQHKKIFGMNIGVNFLGKKLAVGVQDVGRLSIMETRYLDHKRRLVLVKRDDVEHLLLLGDGQQLLIESFKRE